MPKIIDDPNDVPELVPDRRMGKRKDTLPVPQLRVLQVLLAAKGPLARVRISEKCGNKTHVVVGRAIGYTDPERRAVFEQTKDGGKRASLLTMGFVRERRINVEGVWELVVEITDEGRAYAMSVIDEINSLPPLRN